MTLRTCDRISAEPFNLLRWLHDGTRNSMFALVYRLRTFGVDPSFLRHLPVLGRAVNWKYCPLWLTAKDQLVAVLQKPA
jgi:hypothetical protein